MEHRRSSDERSMRFAVELDRCLTMRLLAVALRLPFEGDYLVLACVDTAHLFVPLPLASVER